MIATQVISSTNPLSRVLLPWVERCGLVMLLAMPLMMFLGIAICDIAIVTIAVLFVVRSALLRDFSWLNTKWVQVGLVLWVYLIMISFYALMSSHLSLKQAVPFGRYLIFAAALQYWLLKSEDYRRYLVYALGAAVLFISIDVIYTFFTGLSILGKSSVQYGHYNNITWIWERKFSRIVGLNGKMNNGIMLAWSSMPVIVCLLMAMVKHKTVWRTLLAAAAVITICMAVFMTGERMALLELTLGLLLAFCFIKPLRLLMLIVGGITMLAAILLLTHNPALWDRNVSQIHRAVFGFWNNDYGRITRASFAIFSDHPLFGVGLKQYFLISKSPHYMHFNAINSHVQNVYLEFLTGTGAIGCLLFAGLLYFWLKQFWQRRAVIKAAPILIAVLIAFVLRIWPFASTTSFFFAWGAITFWWMGAWLLASTEEQQHA